jgi:hypothetical protein
MPSYFLNTNSKAWLNIISKNAKKPTFFVLFYVPTLPKFPSSYIQTAKLPKAIQYQDYKKTH